MTLSPTLNVTVPPVGSAEYGRPSRTGSFISITDLMSEFNAKWPKYGHFLPVQALGDLHDRHLKYQCGGKLLIRMRDFVRFESAYACSGSLPKRGRRTSSANQLSSGMA